MSLLQLLNPSLKESNPCITKENCPFFHDTSICTFYSHSENKKNKLKIYFTIKNNKVGLLYSILKLNSKKKKRRRWEV